MKKFEELESNKKVICTQETLSALKLANPEFGTMVEKIRPELDLERYGSITPQDFLRLAKTFPAYFHSFNIWSEGELKQASFQLKLSGLQTVTDFVKPGFYKSLK